MTKPHTTKLVTTLIRHLKGVLGALEDWLKAEALP